MDLKKYRQGIEEGCVHGPSHTKSCVYIYNGWYVVDASVNVNRAACLSMFEGCKDDYGYIDVEELKDVDTITSNTPITSLDELITLIVT